MIHTGTGDLLHSDAHALVNAVNCVGVMGKGIALQFRTAWPDMFRDYKAACTRNEVQPGHVHVWTNPTQAPPLYIFNVPTKRHWRSKSRLEDVQASVDDLVRNLVHRSIPSVAIPALGTGWGGLDWAIVRPYIVQAFQPHPDIEVYVWEPGSR